MSWCLLRLINKSSSSIESRSNFTMKMEIGDDNNNENVVQPLHKAKERIHWCSRWTCFFCMVNRLPTMLSIQLNGVAQPTWIFKWAGLREVADVESAAFIFKFRTNFEFYFIANRMHVRVSAGAYPCTKRNESETKFSWIKCNFLLLLLCEFSIRRSAMQFTWNVNSLKVKKKNEATEWWCAMRSISSLHTKHHHSIAPTTRVRRLCNRWMQILNWIVCRCDTWFPSIRQTKDWMQLSVSDANRLDIHLFLFFPVYLCICSARWMRRT